VAVAAERVGGGGKKKQRNSLVQAEEQARAEKLKVQWYGKVWWPVGVSSVQF
jgi:hypothetical protein